MRALRTQRSLAQGQLAEAMGVSRQTINSIENDRYTPSLPLAIALALYSASRSRRCSMIKDRSQAVMRSKWFMPLFCLGIGVAVLAASWVGGHPGEGAYSLAIMAGSGLFILLVGRSETIRGLWGGGRDERFAQIDLRAPAVAGLALTITLIVAWLTEVVLATCDSSRVIPWAGA